MSNRPSLCWKCVHRENCKLFNKNPEAEVKEDNDDGMLPSLLFNVFGLVMIFLLYKIAFG